MVFSSPEFLFLFLPITWALFLALWRQGPWGRVAIGWLTLASLVFYGIWRPQDLPILIGSAVFNFVAARHIEGPTRGANARFVLAIVANLALLFFFKYSRFASIVATQVGLMDAPVAAHVLPLGISFFTFTQIAYLVDRRRGHAPTTSFLNYLLFVTYFPHLMAGPIIHHREMMPQFDAPAISWENAARGLFVTAIGLLKKVGIADNLAPLADAGFAAPESLALVNAWASVLAYTLQLYFDFSGYSDMAVGVSLLFGIRLPWNFLSPYKATNVSDFWRTWHVTLSRFLRDYVYIPLGGSRRAPPRVALNLLLTMLIGGIWHGAGWTFVLWGALHGSALAIYHLVRDRLPRVPAVVGWAATMAIVVAGWVLFRARSLPDAGAMYARMFGTGGRLLEADARLAAAGPILVIGGLVALFAPNAATLESRFRPRPTWAAGGALAMLLAVLMLLGQRAAPEFLYYDF